MSILSHVKRNKEREFEVEQPQLMPLVVHQSFSLGYK